MIRDAIDPPTLGDANERLASLATALVVELRRIEVSEADLDPSPGIRCRTDAKAVAVAHVADRTFNPRSRPRQGCATGVGVCDPGGQKEGRPDAQGGRLSLPK